MTKDLIVYFSASGNTEKVAEAVANETGGDMVELVPKNPYPDSYSKLLDVAKKELAEGNMPSIEDISINIDDYDTIYIGTPVWFGTYACPIATFLSNYDVDGKTIALFITHGGGGKGNTETDVKKFCPNSELKRSLEIAGSDCSSVASWVKE